MEDIMLRCSVPVGIHIKDDDVKYVRCGKDAVARCVNSYWLICKHHIPYIEKQQWKVEPLKEEAINGEDEGRCGYIYKMA
jgi:hypothetical protein